MSKKNPIVLMKHTLKENAVAWDIKVHTGRVPKGYVQDEGINTSEAGLFRVYIWREGFPLLAGVALSGWLESGGYDLLLHTVDPENNRSPQCQHPGCKEIDTLWCDDGRDGQMYCEVHAVEHGYCTGCRRLIETHESFIDGLCPDCMDEVYASEGEMAGWEEDEYWDDEDEYGPYDFYGESWYDPGSTLDELEDTPQGRYIGPEAVNGEVESGKF